MDQAEKLRQLINNRKNALKNRFRVITVSSGKGGVGKTNFVINLAIALRSKGHRVAILDADFGMANVDILFGIKSRYSIYDILYNDKTINDITTVTKEGIKIIPGGSGIKELSEIEESKRQKLIMELSKLQDIDILLVDTGAGMSNTVLNFVEVADDVIVITNSEPTALTDAYGLIKVIFNNKINNNISLVVNRVINTKEASETYEKLSRTIETFLDKDIKYLGYVVEDSRVGHAVKQQIPFYISYPRSEASLCMNRISQQILGENVQLKNTSIKDYFNKLLWIMRR